GLWRLGAGGVRRRPTRAGKRARCRGSARTNPGIHILGCSAPIELKQDRAAAIDLTEGLSIESILAHDSKHLLDDFAIKLSSRRYLGTGSTPSLNSPGGNCISVSLAFRGSAPHSPT